MSSLAHKMSRIFEEPRPIRFLVSRLLLKTRLCLFFYIEREKYRLKFFPTSLSMSLWLDPKKRNNDIWIIQRLLRSGDTYVDVGANIGQLVLEGSYCVGPKGNVYAFEAHPETALYCQKNIALNRCSNVKVLPVGLSNRVQLLSISNKTSDDQNQVSFDNDGLTILTLPLDLVLENVKPKLIKIDVEGFELFVLKGAIETLKSTSYVYFEYWHEHLKKFQYSFEDIYDFLKENSFQVLQIKKGELLEISRDIKFLECTDFLAYNSNLVDKLPSFRDEALNDLV